MDLNQAIEQIHFPNNISAAQKARQRLSFNELFLIQLITLKQNKN